MSEVDQGADPEGPDECRSENVFWVPAEARWLHLQDNAKWPTIGKLADDAMEAIERDNPRLKGTLRKDYARHALDKQWLGELVVSAVRSDDHPQQSDNCLTNGFQRTRKDETAGGFS